MRISLAIMADPRRSAQAEALLEATSAMSFVDPVIVYDEVGEEWPTGRRSLEAGIGKGDWHIVIQDDAILTPCFYENVLGAIETLSNAVGDKSIISLYTGTSRPLAARVKSAVDKAIDGSWLCSHQLFWGVGIAVPSSHLAPIIDFVDDINLPYDNRIGEFYCRNSMTVYYCIPSLVDHNDALGSLLGHGQSPEPRIAHKCATGLVQWSKKTRYI